MADFETTTDEEDCRVWAWGFANINDPEDVTIGTELLDFLEAVSAIDASTFYFHNLAFDGSFILDYLFNDGYTHTEEKWPDKGEFTSLIDGMGKWYSIKVRWDNGNLTEFRDSLKKLPMSVSDIAKAFKLTESKGEIDYYADRPVGHVLTDEEIDYLKRDVTIVAKALHTQIHSGMTKITVGSDSLAEYRKLTGKKFERQFPVLPAHVDSQIRKAYKGGFAYADSRFRAQRVGSGSVYDVNSLYPSIMYSEMLPYGRPYYSDTLPEVTDEFPLFIVSLDITATLKPDHIPCLQIKNNLGFLATEYLREVEDCTTVVLTNVDLALLTKHYDVDIICVNGAWRFRGARGMFCDFIDKWSAVKEHSDGGIRLLAKLMMNSLYGKFATNPVVTSKIPYLDDDGVVRFTTGMPETRDPVYTAVGAFITAYGRSLTITAAQDHYPLFLYADTDSLHLLDGDHNLDIHPTRLGKWKKEYDFTRAIYARAKAYSEELPDGSTVTHIAGLPNRIAADVTVDDFVNGKVFYGKKAPKRVPGGIVLADTEYTLNMMRPDDAQN